MNNFKVLGTVLKPGNHCLEVGCGSGRLAQFLGTIFHKVTAIDMDPEKIEKASNRCRNNSNLIVMQKDGCDTEFDSHSFDCVIVNRTVHFIGEVPKFFKEVDRLLKPGGQFIVITSPRIEIFSSEECSPGDELNQLFDQFCDENFQNELESYWTLKTSQNFYEYCDPVNGRACPGNNYLYEKKVIENTFVLNPLDLSELFEEFTVFQQKELTSGSEESSQIIRRCQQMIMEYFMLDFEDMYFENVDLYAKNMYFIQINTKN